MILIGKLKSEINYFWEYCPTDYRKNVEIS